MSSTVAKNQVAIVTGAFSGIMKLIKKWRLYGLEQSSTLAAVTGSSIVMRYETFLLLAGIGFYTCVIMHELDSGGG